MFADFILALRQAGLPVSITEYLTLMGAMKAGVAAYDLDDFYKLVEDAIAGKKRKF